MNKATNNMLKQGLLAMLVMLLSAGSALAQQSLFFSEYIEGGGNNKAFEIFNPTDDDIDLVNYIILGNYNGNPFYDTLRFTPGTILASMDVYVVAHADADPAITDVADSLIENPFNDGTSYIAVFNGDDARALVYIDGTDSTIVDYFGTADNDPGSAWDVSGITEATRYYILSRNADVCGGNGGDWNTSRGCVGDACDSTLSELGEWTAIQCGLSPTAGDMPEGADASSDAIIFAGNHNYFCSLSTLTSHLIPQKVNLQQNYPNPFNPRTEILFDISVQDNATLKLYNIKGQEVITLINKVLNPGLHKVKWNGVNNNGKELSSGMYFYELVVGDISLRKKLVLLK